MMQCGECRGSGLVFRVRENTELSLYVSPANSSPEIHKIPLETEQVPCPKCGGRGSTAPEPGSSIPVYQCGKRIGTCVYPATPSASIFYTPRPGDYVQSVIGGEVVYKAEPNLGPGDIELLRGFRWDR